MKAWKSLVAFAMGVKYIWTRGSPFAVFSAMWPANDEAKYLIEAEGIRLALTNHGGAITNLWINDTRGQELDIVLGVDHAGDYPKLKYNPFLNGAIGRYAGFMRNASYQHDGTRVHLAANAHDASVLFNGGDEGWGRQTWDVAVHTKNSITFLLFDRMFNGFPGIAAACLTHTVTPYEWTVAFGVTPLIKAAPLDLTYAAFLNLDGFERSPDGSTSTVLNHTLHVPSAGMRFGVDERNVPTGDLLANREGGDYDFWSSSTRRIGQGLAAEPPKTRHCRALSSCGYDEIFLLTRDEGVRNDFVPSATLSSSRSGIKLDVYSDRDALHIHTWNEPEGALSLKKAQGGRPVVPCSAISLEMRDWPDAANQPQWANRRIMYGMDGLYTHVLRYKFSVEARSQP